MHHDNQHSPSSRSSLLVAVVSVGAVKFNLQAARYSRATRRASASAHDGQFVVVTANVAPGEDQPEGIETVDESPARHAYQSKRELSDEARFAITTHSEDDFSVCFENHLDYSVSNVGKVES